MVVQREHSPMAVVAATSRPQPGVGTLHNVLFNAERGPPEQSSPRQSYQMGVPRRNWGDNGLAATQAPPHNQP